MRSVYKTALSRSGSPAFIANKIVTLWKLYTV
nr:MAG TPA_asm: hypothetical protein [Caudoviricetes sp.]